MDVPCVNKHHDHAHHHQTSEQAKCYNITILARLGHYVAEHQCDWDLLLQLFNYAYYTKEHCSTRMSRLVWCFHAYYPDKPHFLH